MTTQLYKSVTGSRLFGCYTESSDWDFKSVYLPDSRDLVLGNAMGSHASTSEQEDNSSFSLKKFLHLLKKMELNSVELLLSTKPKLNDPRFDIHPVWRELYDNRYKILSANKKPFVGFAKGQAMRYAVRGHRYDTLKSVVNYLKRLQPSTRLRDVPNMKISLNGLEGLSWLTLIDGVYLSVFDRKVSINVKASEALAVYEKPLEQAGERTIQAAGTSGVDWKGLYHAHRVVDEGIELWETGDIKFPLKGKFEYLKIRGGEVYTLEEVLESFLKKLDRLEKLETKHLRYEPDRDWVEDFEYRINLDCILGQAYGMRDVK